MGRFFLTFVVSLFFLPTVLLAQWVEVKRNGTEYVTLKSFCDFYKLPYQPPSSSIYRLQNEKYQITLRQESREISINKVKFWLSFGIQTQGNDWLIPKLDVIKVFDPVLRPYAIANRRAFRGVVIDAGHGGTDKGAKSRRGVLEKNCTLDTSLRLEKILKEAKIPVIMTRRSDVFVDLYERARRANAYRDYIFISVHYNDASPEARGVETYACTPRGAGSTMAGGRVTRADFQRLPGNLNDSLNILLATEVQRELLKLAPNDAEFDRGVKRARFVVLKQTEIPAILVEGGFLSNRMESGLISTPDYRQKIAQAIARGVFAFFQKTNPTPSVSTTPPPSPKPSTPNTNTVSTPTNRPEATPPRTSIAVTNMPSSKTNLTIPPTNRVEQPVVETAPNPQVQPGPKTNTPPVTIYVPPPSLEDNSQPHDGMEESGNEEENP